MDTIYGNDNDDWITAASQVSCATASSSSSCFNGTTSAPPSAASQSNLVWTYMGPIVFIIGIIGNTLVLCVMTRPKMRGTSTSTYLILMSLIDTVVLCSGMIPPFLSAINVINMVTEPPAVCQISKFCEYSSGDAAIWIRVLFTLDRFVAICFAMRKTKWCLQWRAKFYCLAAVCLAMVKNAHVFWTRGARYQSTVVFYNQTTEFTTGNYMSNFIDYTSDYISDGHHPTTVGRASNVSGNSLSTSLLNRTILVLVSNCDYPTPAYAQFEKYIRPYILVTLLGIIPFIAIALSNIFIVRELIELRRVRRRMCTSKMGSQSLFQTTAMCLTASVSFFLFVTPTIALIIGRPYWNVPPNNSYLLAATVCNLTYFLNFGINCYLYCLTGTRFKDTLIGMLRCKRNYKMGSTTFGNVSVRMKQGSNAVASRRSSPSMDPPTGNMRNCIILAEPEVFTIGIGVDNPVVSVKTSEQETNASLNNVDRNSITCISLRSSDENNLDAETVSLASNVDANVNSIPTIHRTIAFGILCSLDIYATVQRNGIKFKRHFTMPLSKMADEMKSRATRGRSYSIRCLYNGLDDSFKGSGVDEIVKQNAPGTDPPGSDRRRKYSPGDSWI